MFYGWREPGYLKVKPLAKSHRIKKTHIRGRFSKTGYLQIGLPRVEGITDADKLADAGSQEFCLC